MKTSPIRWLGLLVPVVLLILGGCAFVNVPLFHPIRTLEEKTVEGEGDAKILLLDVTGIISEERRGISGVFETVSMIDELREALKKAESDKRIAALVIRIN